LFKINQSLAGQMNISKSCVVIAHKDIKLPEFIQPKPEEVQTEGEEKEDYVQSARREAQRILTEAQEEAEKIKINALKEGYEEGKKNAREEIDNFIREQSNEAHSIFSSLEKYKQELYSDLKDNLITLSFDIAEKVVNTAIEKDDKLYIGIVEKAILSLKATDKFVLKVSRGEYARFFKDGNQWLRDETGCVPFEVVCDPQIGEGGCILEAGDRIVNAGVQLQLSKLKHLVSEKAKSE
jgi:flagellar assembly protein FliH